MSIDTEISSFLGLVPYGTHGIEMQHQGIRIALFTNHKSVQRNWRDAVMFALGWHQKLYHDAASAHAVATADSLVVYTWQCFGKENWLQRGATNVDSLCYTVLPADAPESVHLADDDTRETKSHAVKLQ